MRFLLSFCLLFIYSFGLAQPLQFYQMEHVQMGTLFRLDFYASSDSIAQKAAKAAFNRLDELNAVFSNYDAESELSQIGLGDTEISEDLYQVLVIAQEVHRQTDGAFDITIGSLSKLWRRAIRQQRFPSKKQIENAKNKVDATLLRLQKEPKRQLRLAKEMQLDAGGIAKGYALDVMLNILQEHGIVHALLDGGGDLLLGESPPGKEGWNVQIPKGIEEDSVIFKPYLLANCAIASSGDWYRYLEWEGQRYSHIIDPRTGQALSHQAIVTTIHPKAVIADAYASAYSVLANEEIEKYQTRYPIKVQILLKTKDKTLKKGCLF